MPRGGVAVSIYQASNIFLSIHRRDKSTYLGIFTFLIKRLKTGDLFLDSNLEISCDHPELRKILINNDFVKKTIGDIFTDGALRSFLINTKGIEIIWNSENSDSNTRNNTLNKIKNLASGPLSFEPLKRNIEYKLKMLRTLCISIPWICIFYIIGTLALKKPSNIVLLFIENKQFIIGLSLVSICYLLFITWSVRISEDFWAQFESTIAWLIVAPIFGLALYQDINSLDYAYSQRIAEIPARITQSFNRSINVGGKKYELKPFITISFDEATKLKYNQIIDFEREHTAFKISDVENRKILTSYASKKEYPKVTLIVAKGFLGKVYVKKIVFSEGKN